MTGLKQIILKIPFSVSVYMLAIKIITLPSYLVDFWKFKMHVQKDDRYSVSLIDLHPCLIDKTTNTHFESHYVYHPAWAARIIAASKPELHVDVFSTLHFSTILSAFIPVQYYDYRPAKLSLSNLQSKHGDLTNLNFETSSIKSLSCMHTIEHIGLGRYGDPIDPKGDIKAATELSRVLAKDGNLIFVTPIGRPKIAFNAHRIYSYQQVMDLFQSLKLNEFSMIPDDYKKYGLIRNADPTTVASQNWACGCFVFTK